MNCESLSSEEFRSLIESSEILLLDVRTSEEFALGHIPNAINIDVNRRDFDKNVEELNVESPVAVYCQHGVRSLIAANKLVNKGIKIFNLKKGFVSWNGNVVK